MAICRMCKKRYIAYDTDAGTYKEWFCSEKCAAAAEPPLKTEELFGADPNCNHEEDENCWSGVRCKKCGGWFCY